MNKTLFGGATEASKNSKIWPQSHELMASEAINEMFSGPEWTWANRKITPPSSLLTTPNCASNFSLVNDDTSSFPTCWVFQKFLERHGVLVELIIFWGDYYFSILFCCFIVW